MGISRKVNCANVTKNEAVSAISPGRPVAVRMGDGFPKQFLLASATAAASEHLPKKGVVVIRQWQRGEANAPILGEPTSVDAARVFDLRDLLAEFASLPF